MVASKPKNSQNPEESDALYFVLREFAGVNTKNPRQSLADNQFANLFNAIPMGKGNIASLPGHSANLIASPNATANAVSVCFGNTTHILMFRTNGQCDDVLLNASGGVVSKTTFGSAGTFSGGATLNGRAVYSAACAWKNNLMLIVDPTKGYFSWDGTTLTTIDATLVGTTIGVFQGRVVIGYGNVYTMLGVTNYNDENVANGFASYQLGLTAVQGDIVQIKGSISYLFIMTASGIGVINTIQFINGLNYFVLQPLTAGVGLAPQSNALDFDGIILFADIAGIFALQQTPPVYVSDDISGTWGGYSLTRGTGISCARVTVNGRRMPMFLVGNAGAALFLCWLDGKWFFANDNGIGITEIVETTPAAGVSFMYGITAAGGLYQLFGTPASPLAVTIQTKLYDFGSAILNKDFVRAGIEGSWAAGVSVSLTVDTEAGSQNAGTFPMTTVAGLQQLYTDVANSGKYLGMTLTFTSAAGWYVSGLLAEYNEGTPW